MDERYSRYALIEGWDFSKIFDSYVYVVGVGGVGEELVPRLVAMGINVFFYDPDIIEKSNLGRQIAYWALPGKEAPIGRKKIEVLEERLSAGNPEVKIKGFDRKITEKNVDSLAGADIVVDCGDNFELTLLLDNFADKYEIPYISCGSSALSGRVNVFIPNKTPCIDCQLKLKEKVNRKERRPQQCLWRPEPSTVVANMAIASKILDEVLAILEVTPLISQAEGCWFEYSLQVAERWGVFKVKKSSDCEKEHCYG